MRGAGIQMEAVGLVQVVPYRGVPSRLRGGPGADSSLFEGASGARDDGIY